MSAEPTYPRADKAGREVDPMILAQALDHIAKTAHMSRSQTRRIRWIEQRALIALSGEEFRAIDVELPVHATEARMMGLKLKVTRLQLDNAELLEALKDLISLADDAMHAANRDGAEYDRDAELAVACAAIKKATGEQA